MYRYHFNDALVYKLINLIWFLFSSFEDKAKCNVIQSIFLFQKYLVFFSIFFSFRNAAEILLSIKHIYSHYWIFDVCMSGVSVAYWCVYVCILGQCFEGERTTTTTTTMISECDMMAFLLVCLHLI